MTSSLPTGGSGVIAGGLVSQLTPFELRSFDSRLPFGENRQDRVYVLPDGAVQVYIEDSAGNFVEMNYHDAAELNESVVTDLVHREELTPDIGAGRAGAARLLTEASLRAKADDSRS
jgi:hypothetical protein